jgi:hypothetical protein
MQGSEDYRTDEDDRQRGDSKPLRQFLLVRLLIDQWQVHQRACDGS